MSDYPKPDLPPLWDGGYSRGREPFAIHGCYYPCADNNAVVDQLWAYLDELSYAPGAEACLYVSTTAPVFDVLIYRDAGESKVVWRKQNIPGAFHLTARDCSIKGCQWPVALRFPIAESWASGAYILELRAQGRQGQTLHYAHIFLVRLQAESDKSGRLLLVAATSIWAAYNDWGGCNHYEGIAGD